LGAQLAAEGRIQVHRWRLDATAWNAADLARHIGAAYVDAPMRWRHPDALVGARLPARGSTTRTGDFGEIVAAALYGQRLGEQVPFQKLLPKPVRGATQQGPDWR
jgi:hypothetical protein